MRDSDTFSEQQCRHLAHIYAALRECIQDELEYDRSPDFEPLEGEAFEEMWNVVYEGLTELMEACHEQEAAAIETELAEAAERCKAERDLRSDG